MNIDIEYNNLQIGDKLIYKPDSLSVLPMELLKYEEAHLDNFKNNKYDAIQMYNVEQNIDSKIYLSTKTKDRYTSIYIHDVYPDELQTHIKTVVISVKYNDEEYYSIIQNNDYIKCRFVIDMKYRRCNNIDKILNI